MFDRNTQYFFNYTKFFDAFPKTAQEGKEMLTKVGAALAHETGNAKSITNSYINIMNGKEAMGEITNIAEKTVELCKTATFVSALAMPGSFFVLPLAVEAAKKYKMDIVPKSISENFKL